MILEQPKNHMFYFVLLNQYFKFKKIVILFFINIFSNIRLDFLYFDIFILKYLILTEMHWYSKSIYPYFYVY